MTERTLVVDHFDRSAALCDCYRATIAAYAAVAGDEERTTGLDRDFLAVAWYRG